MSAARQPLSDSSPIITARRRWWGYSDRGCWPYSTSFELCSSGLCFCLSPVLSNRFHDTNCSAYALVFISYCSNHPIRRIQGGNDSIFQVDIYSVRLYFTAYFRHSVNYTNRSHTCSHCLEVSLWFSSNCNTISSLEKDSAFRSGKKLIMEITSTSVDLRRVSAPKLTKLLQHIYRIEVTNSSLHACVTCPIIRCAHKSKVWYRYRTNI